MIKKYFVEIRGCNFHNKGDVLMAESIIQRLNEKRSDIRFVSRTLNTHSSLLNQKDLGKCLTSRPSFSSQKLGKLIIKYSVNFFLIKWLLVFVFKFVPENKIDGIIDICGFSYGDFWGNQNLKSDLKYYTNAKKRGIPIILMPKSFGPFSNLTQKKNMKKLWNVCALAFSRDSQSTKFLMSCGIKNIETFNYLRDIIYCNFIKYENISYDVVSSINDTTPNHELLLIIEKYNLKYEEDFKNFNLAFKDSSI